MAHQNKTNLSLSQWLVIGIGFLIFVSLFFVNKTPPLDNKKAVVSSENSTGTPGSDKKQTEGGQTFRFVDLPELTSEQMPLKEVTKNLSSAKNRSDSVKVLKEAVSLSSGMGRVDFGAFYLEMIYLASPSDSALLNTARGFKRASELYQAENRPELYEKSKNKSVQLFEKYLEKRNNDIDAQIDLAILRVDSKNPMVGVQQLLKIANENPKNYKAQLELGIFSLRSNQIKKAEERFTKVTSLEPNKWEGYFYLGMVYKQMGEPQKAKKHFEEASSRVTDPSIKAELENRIKELS